MVDITRESSLQQNVKSTTAWLTAANKGDVIVDNSDGVKPSEPTTAIKQNTDGWNQR